MLNGEVRYYGTSTGVPGVAVVFEGSNSQQAATTDQAGSFSQGVLPGSWEMRPHKMGGGSGAIDTDDATAVLEARVGMTQMTTLISLAGDVSGDGSVTAYDAALIMRRAGGSGETFPATTVCGSDWLFVPTAASMPNQTAIEPELSQGTCTVGALSYQPLMGSAAGQDFEAVLLGDADGSWSAP